jgi:hypothetical protein
MYRFWYVVHNKEIKAIVYNVHIPFIVLTKRMLASSDTIENKAAQTKQIHCTSLTTTTKLFWCLPARASESCNTLSRIKLLAKNCDKKHARVYFLICNSEKRNLLTCAMMANRSHVILQELTDTHIRKLCSNRSFCAY